MSNPDRLWPALLLSILAGLVLTLVPLPGWAQPWRPSWLALVVIYWLMYEPQRVGLLAAWLVGLMLDTLRGVLLGQHALALTVVAFLSMQLHLRVRVFPIAQQTATVFMLVALYEFLLFWVDGVTGEPGSDWRRWLSVPGSAAFWPLVSSALHRIRQARDTSRTV
ncbi:MAG: rod shape-determining protein MreD [Gammaproteobacteria bacterium]|nr:rod shape-determining protein MreD [Gammaproteobacteria bacterium]NNF60768.1 rod shape-determining protein MreD [Gammaproteobacteria bacterium]NNM20221.1 rod shape-determining protein MreD [Gammaproteobacteria bacterium]